MASKYEFIYLFDMLLSSSSISSSSASISTQTETDLNGYVTLIESNDWQQRERQKIQIIPAALFIPLVPPEISALKKVWKRF